MSYAKDECTVYIGPYKQKGYKQVRHMALQPGVYIIGQYDRVNTDYSNAPDEFRITVKDGSWSCVRHDKPKEGWWMDLKVRLPCLDGSECVVHIGSNKIKHNAPPKQKKHMSIKPGVYTIRKQQRENPDHRDANDVFEITVSGSAVTCERVDKKRGQGWWMDLEVRLPCMKSSFANSKKSMIKLKDANWKIVQTIPAGRSTAVEVTSSSSYTNTTESRSSKETSHEWSIDVEQNYAIFGQKGKMSAHYGGSVKSMNAKLNAMVESKAHTKKTTTTWNAANINRQLFQLQLEGVDERGNYHYWTSTLHTICIPLGENLPHVSTVLRHM